MKKQLAVLFGGQSSEHEVSCKSAINVIEGLDKEKYQIYCVGITKEGRWIYTPDVSSIKDGSWKKGKVTAVISPDADQKGLLLLKEESYQHANIDVVFPVLHGKFGEDGTVQGLFELAGIPYVGCNLLSSAVSMDKISTKIFVDRLQIPQAKYVADIARDLSDMELTISKVEAELGYPVFVKPSNAGSSQGVSKASNQKELRDAIVLAKQHDNRVLIEETILGREVECAILGGDDPKPSVIGEVVAAAEFYDFDAKYNNDQSKTIVDPDITPEVKEKIRVYARDIFKCVGGYGLSRVDFFVKNSDEGIVFNEINTLPGFTSISMYPMLWEAMGVSKQSLLDELIELAYKR